MLTLEQHQEQVQLDEPQRAQSVAYIIYEMENELRNDGFNKTAECIAVARFELYQQFGGIAA